MSNTFKVGELLPERSPLSKTWMNYDGSRTIEFSETPVHYKDADGNYHNIDTKLYDEADLQNYHDPVEVTGECIFTECRNALAADPSINRDNYDYQGLKVPFLARLPRVFDRGYLIGDGEETLMLKPVQASPSKGYIDSDNPNTIKYQDAWNDTDVKLELLSNAIKETIILKSDKAPTTFKFKVTGELSEDLKAGSMELSPAWLVDANGTYRDVIQHLLIDGDTFVVLDVDTTDLVYPVLIDPTITVSNSLGTTTLENDVRANSPTTITKNPATAQMGYLDSYRIFLKYPNLLANIPSNAQILDAKYNMYVSNGSGATNMRLVMHAVMTDYNADTLNWNNQPVMDSTLKSPEVVFDTTYNKWIAFDVKNILQALVDGTAVKAFGIKNAINDNSGVTLRLSKNAVVAQRPNFKITFNMPPDKPTVTKPNGGESWNSLETVTWTAANDVQDFIHAPFPFSNEVTYQDSASYGQVFTIPEANAVLRKAALKLRATASGATYTMFLTMAKQVNDWWTFDKNLILAQQDVTIPDPVNLQWVEMTLPNLSVPKGTHVALHVEMKNGNKTNYYGAATDGFFDLTEGNGIVDALNTGINFQYYLNYSAGTPSNQLTYQIQLSSNSGSTWKTIVNATPAGATSYAYDFIGEPESALSKIRIRAYDGYNYGAWDESDGVFTIQHNVAPSTPTNLAPNGTIEDRATPTRMSWKHNDPNGVDPQSKFDLQWRAQGTSTWSTVTQSTTDQFYNAAGNLFPAGKIEWRVRTYDQAGLAGPYSAIAVFTAAVRTAKPTITYPTSGALVPIARPTVTWSHSDQVKYWVRVKNGSTIIFERQATAANKALTISTDLVNNTSYILEIAVMDTNGLWSDFANVAFVISYTPPNKPYLIPTLDNVNGHISFDIKSADIIGTTPATTYYDIFRKADNGSWIKLADGLGATGKSYEETTVWTIDFKGKVGSPSVGQGVTGSLVENGNIYRLENRPDTNVAPLNIKYEASQAHYDNVMFLDGSLSRVTNTTAGNYNMAAFNWDIFRALEDKFGPAIWNGKTTAAEKRAEAIKLITWLTFRWTGKGNSGTGGTTKSIIELWQTNTQVWENPRESTSSSVATIQTSSGASNVRIDANGWIGTLARSEATVGGTSAIETDYTQLEITVVRKGISTPWIDYTPSPNKAEQYFVRAYGINGTIIDSEVVTVTVQLKNVQIALASDPSQFVTLTKRDAGKETSTRQSATNDFEGRPFPMTEFSDNYGRTFDYKYKAWSYGDVVMMRHLAMSGEALLLRDNWGRKDFVTIDTINIEETRAYHAVSFQPVKIYYVEGI
ncbi:hypothetical protein vBBceSLY5_0018 [Bacillus phage vB_BceS_LY5]|uniref:hypothetical protein n=1 Tax=Bacillus phage vB_BceS_LY5 TaxID=2996058 RepID=UPI004054D5B5|nr:hypothetical protein vBBceSLY5_0018 [Bacillus phage vB_BceS_LY5]